MIIELLMPIKNVIFKKVCCSSKDKDTIAKNIKTKRHLQTNHDLFEQTMANRDGNFPFKASYQKHNTIIAPLFIFRSYPYQMLTICILRTSGSSRVIKPTLAVQTESVIHQTKPKISLDRTISGDFQTSRRMHKKTISNFILW